MTVIATDDFSGSLSNYDVGPGSFGNMQIVSGGLRASITTDDVAIRRNAESFNDDQYAIIQISSHTSSSGIWPGVATRMQSASDGSGYAFQGDSGANSFRIYEVTDNGASQTFTAIGSAFTYNPVNGDWLMLESIGTTHKAYVDSGSGFVELASRSDSTYSSGKPGVMAYADPTSSLVLDNLILGNVDFELLINEGSHSLTSDNLTLTTGGSVDLVIQDANHALSSDNVGLTQLHILSIDGANHVLTSDNLVLTQLHILLINEATHAHSAENVTITQAQILAIQESNHAHSAENLALTQLHILQIQDATHAHTAEYLTLTQDQLLSIQDALHALTSDNVGITSGLEFEIQEATHALTSDNVILTQAQLLAIQEATHALTSDNTVLSQGHILVISEALHAMIADNVVLSVPSDGAPTTPLDRIFVVKYENRVYAILK